jgi:hypothetical protein
MVAVLRITTLLNEICKLHRIFKTKQLPFFGGRRNLQWIAGVGICFLGLLFRIGPGGVFLWIRVTTVLKC